MVCDESFYTGIARKGYQVCFLGFIAGIGCNLAVAAFVGVAESQLDSRYHADACETEGVPVKLVRGSCKPGQQKQYPVAVCQQYKQGIAGHATPFEGALTEAACEQIGQKAVNRQLEAVVKPMELIVLSDKTKVKVEAAVNKQITHNEEEGVACMLFFAQGVWSLGKGREILV